MMWPTIRTLWQTLSRKAPRNGSRQRRTAGFRPRLEVLEDRTLPASFGYALPFNGIITATAADSAGDLYVTGSSVSLPTTPGAFKSSGGAYVGSRRLDPPYKCRRIRHVK
jgi:hypothetical protein